MGGNWRVPPAEIALEQVQRALNEPVMVVAAGKADKPDGCLVQRVVHGALDDAVAEANRGLDRRLASITLADLGAGVRQFAGTPFTLSPGLLGRQG